MRLWTKLVAAALAGLLAPSPAPVVYQARTRSVWSHPSRRCAFDCSRMSMPAGNISAFRRDALTHLLTTRLPWSNGGLPLRVMQRGTPSGGHRAQSYQSAPAALGSVDHQGPTQPGSRARGPEFSLKSNPADQSAHMQWPGACYSPSGDSDAPSRRRGRRRPHSGWQCQRRRPPRAHYMPVAAAGASCPRPLRQICASHRRRHGAICTRPIPGSHA